MGYVYLRTGAEKPVVLVLLVYTIGCIGLCSYWLYLFWNCQKQAKYSRAIKSRRPIYIVYSYVLLAFPLLIEEAMSNVFLYFYHVSEKQERNRTEPIYFSPGIDLLTHFLFWLFFWGFYQLKTFKFWMLRIDYDFHRYISLESLREEFGVDYSRQSIFLRYHHIFGNSSKIFSLQLLLLVLTVTVMVILRLQVNLLAEVLFSFIVVVLEFAFIFFISSKIKHINDHFYLRPELDTEFRLSIVGACFFGAGIIAFYLVPSNNVLYQRVIIAVILINFFTIFCYSETVWVLKHIRAAEEPVLRNSAGHESEADLHQVIEYKEGFETFLQFLVGEFSCENLLCYVEITHFMKRWDPNDERNDFSKAKTKTKEVDPPIQQTALKSENENSEKTHVNDVSTKIEMMITTEMIMRKESNVIEEKNPPANVIVENVNENDKDMREEQIIPIASAITMMGPQDTALELDRMRTRSMSMTSRLEDFMWVRYPQAIKQYSINDHWEYLGRKYLYASASLQINIPGALRSRCVEMSPFKLHEPGKNKLDPETEQLLYWNLCVDIRKELWSLMSDSFNRFRHTNKYRSFSEDLSKAKVTTKSKRSLIRFPEPKDLKVR